MTHQRAVSTLAAERYLLDEMSEIERMAFEEHYFDCADCADEVRVGELMRTTALKERLESPAVSAPKAFERERTGRATRWATTIVPWAAAAMLALFTGYQSLFVVPALRRDIAPQALDAVTLRPASRGEEPVVRIHKGQSAVLLALDVNGEAPGHQIEYELKADDDGSRFQREAAAPDAGFAAAPPDACRSPAAGAPLHDCRPRSFQSRPAARRVPLCRGDRHRSIGCSWYTLDALCSGATPRPRADGFTVRPTS